MHTCTHRHTNTYGQSLLLLLAQSRVPSEPALGHLCATQVLLVSTGYRHAHYTLYMYVRDHQDTR